MDERTALQEYIRSHVIVSESGCWIGTGRPTTAGYCHGHFRKRTEGLHRMAYRAFVGDIPQGYWIDHTCHNADEGCNADERCLHRRCCNPDHLEAVTPRENLMRGRTPAARNAAKTHCAQGHEFTPENTAFRGRERACRACRRQKKRRAK